MGFTCWLFSRTLHPGPSLQIPNNARMRLYHQRMHVRCDPEGYALLVHSSNRHECNYAKLNMLEKPGTLSWTLMYVQGYLYTQV